MHEGEAFPLELLGERPQEETFLKLLKKFSYVVLKMGKVTVKYGEPVSMSNLMHQYSTANSI